MLHKNIQGELQPVRSGTILERRIYESLISIVHNHTKDGGVPHYSTNAGGAPATTSARPAALSTTVQLYV
jgi:hypothetical protein